MKKKLILVCCSLFLCTGCSKTSYFQTTDLVEEVEDTDTDSEESVLSEIQSNTIYVQVAGAVANPDVYALPMNARVFEAIKAAGGLLEEADDSDINQAQILSDGEKLYVYTTEEKAEIEKQQESNSDGLININTATAMELTALPGIGQSKADQIVAYREGNGSFSDIEEIKQVPGIGDGIFSKISSYIKI
ncbi:MAG: ComEA family DNA-binding protein [Pseudobutyrivibrio sp.]|nr:ComEA family DNA-binding protein [Pseudobutyrivibrio sp.]